MASNKNNGGASMYYYGNNPSQSADDEERFKKTAAIAIPILIVVAVLIKLLCFWIRKEIDEEVVGTGTRNRVRGQQRPSNGAGGWPDRAPSPTVAGAAVDVVSSVPAAEPPLVCTYTAADGWVEGSCGVCLADLADGDVLRVLPLCMHYFHDACVGEWLRGHDTCPLCRAPLVPPVATA